MTKYICECLDGARKCTHETPGFSTPTLCCVRANATCHWRKVENQEGEAPAPIIPEWCREGAWVHVTPDNREPYYGKVYAVDCSGVWIAVENAIAIRTFFINRIRPARLRPWTYKEAPETLKVIDKYEPDRIVCLFLASKNKNSVQYTTLPAWYIDTKTLMDKYMELDGSPCGVLEHKNEQGEWVE